uniref:Ig-like domain-containing protein n=1 Tax=Chelydra serpentina TaxID=8475 RepID=A0A8C3XR64_CHESE
KRLWGVTPSACQALKGSHFPLRASFLLVPSTVSFKVIGPDRPIRVLVGEDALLPCHLSPSMSAESMEVRWFRSMFSAVVHLYRDGRDQDGQQIAPYRSRTKLLKDGIANGTVSLRIDNITPSDEGTYGCHFQSPTFYEEAALELEVAGQ